MFEIFGSDIFISRGEAATMNVAVYSDGALWPMHVDDKLVLTVYELHSHKDVLELESEYGQTAINFEKEHTKTLRGDMGYGVTLLFASGDRATVVGETPTNIPRFYVLED